MIETSGLTKRFDDILAVDHISAKIRDGSVFGLIGTNGAGKSTFLRMVSGILKPDEGEVLIDGQRPGIYTKSILSYLPEKTYLSDWMKAGDALNMFSDFYQDFDAAKAKEMLGTFHLDEGMRLKSMSKGMQEKLQLILVMSRAAKLYILDEPLSGIDPAARDSILDIILNNYSENSTVMLSTHLIYDVERIFDDVIMMSYGQLIAADSADAIREKTGKSLDAYFREVFRC